MKKSRLDKRIENAFNAFFENEAQIGSDQIVFNNNSALLCDQASTKNTETPYSISGLFKLIFLFLPSAFFLYKLSMIFVYYNIFEGIGFRSDMGLNEFLFFQFFLQPLLGIFFVLAGSFMTLIGIGSVKEARNLVVPGTIITSSLLLVGLFSFLSEPLRGQVVMYYSSYLFPIVLIVSGLIKNRITENKDSFFQ